MRLLTERPTTNSVCPFVEEPRKECYCLNMNSSKIYFAILFCGGDYTECRIYRAVMGETLSPLEEENQSRSTNNFRSSRKVSG